MSSLVDPKVLFAVFAWAVYSFEVLARRTMGWNGRRAAWLSAVGFDHIIPKPIAPSALVPLVEAHLPGLANLLGLVERAGLTNVRVVTCDMNAFEIDPERFDRVVSVEMFEHMRNWSDLFARVRRWLRPGGRFFMHVFVHRAVPYAFEVEGAGNASGEPAPAPKPADAPAPQPAPEPAAAEASHTE